MTVHTADQPVNIKKEKLVLVNFFHDQAGIAHLQVRVMSRSGGIIHHLRVFSKNRGIVITGGIRVEVDLRIFQDQLAAAQVAGDEFKEIEACKSPGGTKQIVVVQGPEAVPDTHVFE